MVSAYVPERGDIIWISFDPSLGHEQTGKRPALVLSPKAYNQRSSLLVACPITSKIKGYPFEVVIDAGSIHGAILSDQIKSLDWRTRQISYADEASSRTLESVSAKLRLLLM